MSRLLSEELSAKLRSCISEDGIILTKKLEKALSYEEQWTLVMAYMSRIRREKLRHNTSAAIAEVKSAVARKDFTAAGKALDGVYLSSDKSIIEMTRGEASARCVEITAIQGGLATARERLIIALAAFEQGFAQDHHTLIEIYSQREVVEVVARMPE